MTNPADTVLFEIRGHVAIVTIDRPGARNAVNEAVATGIETAVDRIEADDSIWVGVLAATPPVFSAGADLKEIRAGRRDHLRTERGGFAGITARARSKPLIAAVDGAALGGGMEMCLACDLIVASTAARFGIPEVRRSLVAAAGGLFRLPRAVPFNVAMEMALTGEAIEAERAHQLGFVNVLTEPGGARDAAIQVAEQIALGAPGAVRSSRRVLRAVTPPDEVLGWELSAAAMSEALSSEDAAEGLAAFAEKRSPVWRGR